MGDQDPIVVCLANVWSDHKPSETTLQLIFHIDIKKFINKLSNFEEANWMGPDLKIHPAFKALSVGIRCYYYFIGFPESAASVDVWYLELMGSTTVSGIRNQLVKEMCVELFYIYILYIIKKCDFFWEMEAMKQKIKWHVHAESTLE